jgi:hypothetical protein
MGMASAPAVRPVPSHFKRRLLEILPGTITWTLILGPMGASLFFAQQVAVGIVLLDAYWLLRSFVVVINIVRTYLRLRVTRRTDWWQRCLDLSATRPPIDPREVYHLTLIPTYTESYVVLEATVQAIVDANYPAERKIVAIVTRETDKAGASNVARLRDRFGKELFRFFHVKDPLLPGIVIGKSAAMAYAGPVVKGEIDRLGIALDRVIVTDLDSDFRVHRQYFAHLTFRYVQDAARDACIFQPIPMFHNNLWKVPAAVRIMASACTQWQMFLQQRPDRLVAFSSYSMSLRMLHEVGYWDDDVIPEDSRFYWKAFFHFGERFHMGPVFLPILGDAPRAHDYASSHVSQYNQIKRWAWGAADFPYVVLNILRHSEIPLSLRMRRFGYMVFNHLAWATLPVLLIAGLSIPLLIDLDFNLSTRAQVLGAVSAGLLTVTLSNILVLVLVEIALNPPRPRHWPLIRHVWAYLQLLAYPFVGLALSCLPALEAQTRLIFGHYLEYKVTEKVTDAG